MRKKIYREDERRKGENKGGIKKEEKWRRESRTKERKKIKEEGKRSEKKTKWGREKREGRKERGNEKGGKMGTGIEKQKKLLRNKTTENCEILFYQYNLNKHNTSIMNNEQYKEKKTYCLRKLTFADVY